MGEHTWSQAGEFKHLDALERRRAYHLEVAIRNQRENNELQNSIEYMYIIEKNRYKEGNPLIHMSSLNTLKGTNMPHYPCHIQAMLPRLQQLTGLFLG